MTTYEIPEGHRQSVARMLMLAMAAERDAAERDTALREAVRTACPEAFVSDDAVSLRVEDGRIFVVPAGETARHVAELAVAPMVEPEAVPSIDIDAVLAVRLRECLGDLRARPADAHLYLDRLAKRLIWDGVPLSVLKDAMLLEGLAADVASAIEGEGDHTASSRLLVERFFLGTAERVAADLASAG